MHMVAHLRALPGKREALRAYEAKALALFHSHGGEVLAVFGPDAALGASLGTEDPPDEIHVLRIRSREALEAFLNDPDRLALEPERLACMASAQVYAGKSFLE